MEDEGMAPVVLFMALKTYFSPVLFRRFTSYGGFSMYLGKGERKPYNPLRLELVSFHFI